MSKRKKKGKKGTQRHRNTVHSNATESPQGDSSSLEQAERAVCNFTSADGKKWLPLRDKKFRKGSHCTPKYKLEFFQPNGNKNHPFKLKVLFDTGCSRSLLSIKVVRKYNLHFDNSKAARRQSLYAANGELIKTCGIIDLQVRYKRKIIPICFIEYRYQ